MELTTSTRKLFAIYPVALCMLLVFAAASCSSGSGSDERTRRSDAPALLVQCALFFNRLTLPSRMSWVDGQGKVALTDSGKINAFNSWYQAHKTTAINGNTLEGWANTAAANNKLPDAVCGSGGEFTASTLQRQVYPGKPDPWRS